MVSGTDEEATDVPQVIRSPRPYREETAHATVAAATSDPCDDGCETSAGLDGREGRNSGANE